MRLRSQQQHVHVVGACRFAEDCYVARITAESSHVVAYPLERTDDIEDGEVTRLVEFIRALTSQCGVAEPAEGADAIVDRHHHDLVRRRQVTAVVQRSCTNRVSAAVYPHHHRPPSVTRRHIGLANPWRIHVEVETILAADRMPRSGGIEAADRARELRARRAKIECLARTGPWFGWLRRSPSERPDRRLGERNAEPCVTAVSADEADDCAGCRDSARCRIERALLAHRVAASAGTERREDQQRGQSPRDVRHCLKSGSDDLRSMLALNHSSNPDCR